MQKSPACHRHCKLQLEMLFWLLRDRVCKHHMPGPSRQTFDRLKEISRFAVKRTREWPCWVRPTIVQHIAAGSGLQQITREERETCVTVYGTLPVSACVLPLS